MTEEDGQGATRTRGGLTFRVGRSLFFLAADVAVKLAPRPQIARIPGAPPGLLGLALSDGLILPVLEVGPERGAMIVCVHHGELLGLVGGSELESGMFVAAADGSAGIVRDGEVIPMLDLAAIYARVHAVTWGAAWGTRRAPAANSTEP